ncbi:hypothetical protein MKY91_05710 [Alkalicoccobacillus gibsonii]|uniref:YcxB-like protein domain-containing protein n=1 Tax=Alkalicoccobacillus gibsonii TaxID=79881 RepID=A0ABU9VFP7_9BACI
MENLVKHHPIYKKRKLIGLIFSILLVGGYANITILLGLLVPGVFLYLFFSNIVVISVVGLGYIYLNEFLLKITKKVSYKSKRYKDFIGKRTFTYNEEFIEVNEQQYKWTEFSVVDTDDLYVYLYLNDCEEAVMFPKFPKDFPLEERDKLNQIIQEKFNVNIRL